MGTVSVLEAVRRWGGRAPPSSSRRTRSTRHERLRLPRDGSLGSADPYSASKGVRGDRHVVVRAGYKQLKIASARGQRHRRRRPRRRSSLARHRPLHPQERAPHASPSGRGASVAARHRWGRSPAICPRREAGMDGEDVAGWNFGPSSDSFPHRDGDRHAGGESCNDEGRGPAPDPGRRGGPGTGTRCRRSRSRPTRRAAASAGGRSGASTAPSARPWSVTAPCAENRGGYPCADRGLREGRERMKVVILCGGMGTRLPRVHESLRKADGAGGQRPDRRAHHARCTPRPARPSSMLCLGYMGHVIRDYFLNYEVERPATSRSSWAGRRHRVPRRALPRLEGHARRDRRADPHRRPHRGPRST